MKSKAKPEREKRGGSSGAARGSASGIITKIIKRLLTHRDMWAVSRGNLKTLPSDGQLGIIIKDLKRARKIILWPACYVCARRPSRGGKRQGSAMCEECYHDDSR